MTSDSPENTCGWQLCRLCAREEQCLLPIFQGPGQELKLLTKIRTCLPVHLELDDHLPQAVCTTCVDNLEFCHQFVQESINADHHLRAIHKEKQPAEAPEENEMNDSMLQLSPPKSDKACDEMARLVKEEVADDSTTGGSQINDELSEGSNDAKELREELKEKQDEEGSESDENESVYQDEPEQDTNMTDNEDEDDVEETDCGSNEGVEINWEDLECKSTNTNITRATSSLDCIQPVEQNPKFNSKSTVNDGSVPSSSQREIAVTDDSSGATGGTNQTKKK